MNNWRFLLLAVVAVFQPIASFTDSNLIDGRQQCSDRISYVPIQDTRSSLHGTSQLGKTVSALRRLSVRDETREEHRNLLRQRDFRGRVARKGASEIARSSRIEQHLERSTSSPSRERFFYGQREETTSLRSIRDLKHQDLTRRVVDRTSRDTLDRRNDRVNTVSPSDRLYRDDKHSGNELLPKSFDSKREIEPIRSVERSFTLNRNARSVLSGTQNDFEDSNKMNSRQRIARARMTTDRRESTIRPDTRRFSEHTEKRRVMQRSVIAREDTQDNRPSVRINQGLLATDRFDERRDQREARRESRQQNKENIDHSAPGERRMQVVRRIKRESRISNVMNDQKERNIAGQRHIRHDRVSRDIHDKVRENSDRGISNERVMLERKLIRETGILNTRNKREVHDQPENRHNEGMAKETRNENRDNLGQRFTGERIQMDRRDIRESRLINARNTRDVADRREIRDTERMTSEARDGRRDNQKQWLSRERIQIDRRDFRDSRLVDAPIRRAVTDRRELRDNERMTRETRENLEQRLSREKNQLDRRDIRESRLINARNTRDVADRREIRDNERMAREARDETRDNHEQRLSREKNQLDRRDIHESRLINARNTRDVAYRREIRDNERITREARDETRDNHEQRLSRERIQMDRRDIRDSRFIDPRNTRDVTVRRKLHDERITREIRENAERRLSRERNHMNRGDIRDSINARETRDVADRREIQNVESIARERMDENKENLEKRLSHESNQRDRTDFRESKLINSRITKHVANRYDIRDIERMTRETRQNTEQRISAERIQMDRNTREVSDRREIRGNERMTWETRDGNRDNQERQRLSHERIQVDQRYIRDSRHIDARNTRDIADRREIRDNERISRDTRYETRDNQGLRLSQEGIQMNRRDIREVRNTQTARNVNDRREIKDNERSTRLEKENHNRLSVAKSQVDRRNTREFRLINNLVRDRTDAKLHVKTKEKTDHSLAHQRIVWDRQNTLDSRIGNTLHVRDLESRQEIRESREMRDHMGENTDRRLAPESRQIDRRNTLESRINRLAARYERTVETDAESRRDIKFTERLSGQLRGDQETRERRVDSRSTDRVNVKRHSSMMDRRARSADRRNFREIRDSPKLSRSADTEPRSEVFRSRVENLENRERQAVSAHTHEVEMSRNRGRNSVMDEKMETESDFTAASWQYVLYTLQAAYLCALFMQMLTPSRTEKSHKMSLRWLPVSSHYKPIKVD